MIMADVRMTSENRWMKPRGLHFCLANIRLKKKMIRSCTWIRNKPSKRNFYTTFQLSSDALS